MKIGVLGAGNIGGNLARRFAEHGHEIRFGMRDPDKAAPLVDACGPSASAGDIESAAAFGDVIVLAVPWGAVDNVLSAAGDLSGKVLIDATNALTWDDGPVPAVTPSGAEIIAERCKGARVVKAFNTIGAEHLLDPNKTGTQADMLFCGDDEAARGIVSQLAAEIGFHPVDAGPLRNARLVEHVAILWIHLAMRAGLGRNIAFKVMQGE